MHLKFHEVLLSPTSCEYGFDENGNKICINNPSTPYLGVGVTFLSENKNRVALFRNAILLKRGASPQEVGAALELLGKALQEGNLTDGPLMGYEINADDHPEIRDHLRRLYKELEEEVVNLDDLISGA